jgi:hypothetical protein
MGTAEGVTFSFSCLACTLFDAAQQALRTAAKREIRERKQQERNTMHEEKRRLYHLSISQNDEKGPSSWECVP